MNHPQPDPQPEDWRGHSDRDAHQDRISAEFEAENMVTEWSSYPFVTTFPAA